MTDTKGFDFRSGVPLQQIPDGAIVAGHVGDDEIIVVRRGDQFFAVGSHCTHYHGPLADGLLVGDTVGVRGITRVSVFGRARRCARPRSIRSPAGASSDGAMRSSSRTNSADSRRPGLPHPRCRARSSSSAAARRGSRPRTCCDAGASTAPSRCSARTMTRRSIGRTCPRIIWPVRRRKTGFRSVRPSSTRTTRSTCGSTRAWRRSTPRASRCGCRAARRTRLTRCCSRRAQNPCG